MRQLSAVLGLIVLATACASGAAKTAPSTAPAPKPVAQDTSRAAAVATPYPSTYQRHPNPPVLIRNATIMTATGQEIQGGSILFRDGRIVAVGTTVQAPSDATVVDGTGKELFAGTTFAEQ